MFFPMARRLRSKTKDHSLGPGSVAVHVPVVALVPKKRRMKIADCLIVEFEPMQCGVELLTDAIVLLHGRDVFMFGFEHVKNDPDGENYIFLFNGQATNESELAFVRSLVFCFRASFNYKTAGYINWQKKISNHFKSESFLPRFPFTSAYGYCARGSDLAYKTIFASGKGGQLDYAAIWCLRGQVFPRS